MPITSFTVGGVEVNPLFHTLEIRESAGNVSTLSCDVISVGSPVARFSVFDAVVVEEDGEKIFTGTVTQARERGCGGPNIYDEDGAPQIVTTITADDQERLAERITITLDIAEGTSLKSALTSVVSQMSALGVTLHASQADGPSLPEMSFDHVRAAEVFRALSDATGWDRRIDYDKQVRMWDPGDLPAPFDIDEFDDPAKWTGDVEVETILGDDYANKVIVLVDLPEEKGRVESFDGDGVTDTFTLAYTPTALPGIIHRFVTSTDAVAGGETFGIKDVTFDNDGNPVQWWYDAATNSITRNAGVSESGFTYKLTFDGVFSAEAEAEDSAAILANGLYEIVIRNPEGVTSEDAAQDVADAVLAARLQAGEQTVTYETRETAPTLHAGQEQTITATARNVSGDYIITYLRVRAEVPATADFAADGLGLIRTVTAKRNTLTGRFEDTYRDWLRVGGGGGGTTVIGDGGPGQSGPAPPDESVQFNDSGQFGGNANFTFDKTTTTVMIGTGHTPGGADNLLVGEGHTVS